MAISLVVSERNEFSTLNYFIGDENGTVQLCTAYRMRPIAFSRAIL